MLPEPVLMEPLTVVVEPRAVPMVSALLLLSDVTMVAIVRLLVAVVLPV